MKKITLLLVMLISSLTFSQVTIGTGNDGGTFESPPVNAYYGFSYGQSIYLASEINASGNITSVDFQLVAGADMSSADDMVDVWIGHTTKSDFTSTSDWVDVSTLTQVFTNGTVSIAGGVMTITFSSPFAYNGTDNLVIAVDANEAGFGGTGDRISATDGPTSNLSLMHRSDTNNNDPLSPAFTGALFQSRGNITFNGITQSCPSPTTLTATNITTSSADLGWTDAAGNWDIEWGTGGFTPTGIPNINDITNNPYNLSSLAVGTQYDFYVRADCGMDNTDVSSWVGPFSFTTLFNIPSNDECANPVGLTVNSDLNCAVVTAGTTGGATASSEDSTGVSGTPNTDVWYSFTATSSGHQVVLSNIVNLGGGTSTSVDMGMAVYDATGGCGALAFTDTSDPNTLNLTGLTVSNLYYVRVYGWSSDIQNNDFDICIGTLPPPPANDECSGAILLTVNSDANCGTVTNGTVAGATDSGVSGSTCGGTDDDDVWYRFVATSTDHIVSLINVSGNTTDMYHAVYDSTPGCGSLGAALVCNDGDISTLSGLTIGNTYYVQVYTWTSTTGRNSVFDICIGTPPPPPANDDCSGAIGLTIGMSTAGTTFSATGSSSTSCNGSIGNDVWYTVVGDGGDLTITVDSPSEDSQIGVFDSADCAGITLGSCDFSIDPFTNPASLTFTSVNGTLYYIQVGAWISSGAPSNFDIIVNSTLSNEDFDNELKFKYYPNPVNNTLSLRAQNSIQNVSIINMLGQEVLKVSPNTISEEVDMSSLRSGAYFVRVTINDVTEIVRVLKK